MLFEVGNTELEAHEQEQVEESPSSHPKIQSLDTADHDDEFVLAAIAHSAQPGEVHPDGCMHEAPSGASDLIQRYDTLLLTPDKLTALEQMSELLLPISVIAANLEVSELELRLELKEQGSPAYNAYVRGYGKQLTALHKAILKSAADGSNPAQVEALKFLQQCRNDFTL